eukprot:6212976-Pleurochrysis_carterae.AAC.2
MPATMLTTRPRRPCFCAACDNCSRAQPWPRRHAPLPAWRCGPFFRSEELRLSRRSMTIGLRMR